MGEADRGHDAVVEDHEPGKHPPDPSRAGDRGAHGDRRAEETDRQRDEANDQRPLQEGREARSSGRQDVRRG
jgi:hypothetical protein